MKCSKCGKPGIVHGVKDEKATLVMVCCDCYMGILGTPCSCVTTGPNPTINKLANIPPGYEVIDPAVLKSEYFVAGVRWERQRSKSQEKGLAMEHVVAAINHHDKEKANAAVK